MEINFQNLNRVMKIFFLGPKNVKIFNWLISKNENVISTEDKVSLDLIKKYNFNFLISYKYRFIITEDILRLFPNRAINLHISYLPFNRGSDPNLWSFVEDTKKGVTIHYIDKGIDTGEIIVQKEHKFLNKNETLKSSYDFLNESIQNLFIENWDLIKQNKIKSFPQIGKGSFHKSSDKKKIVNSPLFKGWDMTIDSLKIFKNIKK